jgi:hypothetical protein
MNSRQDETLRNIAKVIDPNACWDSEPPNLYAQDRVDRALQKAKVIMDTLLPAPAALAPDVVRLVIAARNVAFDDPCDDDARQELDAASEAFADRVPWEDEPEGLPQRGMA